MMNVKEYFKARLNEANTTGSLLAAYEVGECYDEGFGTVKNKKAAELWYRYVFDNGGLVIITNGAKLNQARAQYILGQVYRKEQAGLSSREEAFKWFFKSAGQGYAAAEYYLGQCYLEDWVVVSDRTEAFKWIFKSAMQGFALAEYTVGSVYQTSKLGFMDDSFVPIDSAEARKWYLRSAKQEYACAQNVMGSAYTIGDLGVQKDYAAAFTWFSKSANQGNAEGQWHLAECYAQGRGVKKDDSEALRWYRKSAEQKYLKALITLAERGYADAQNNLGMYYVNSNPLYPHLFTNDDVKWFRQSANQGYAEGQYNLGMQYATGRGIGKDEAEAVRWFRKAAAQGHTNAKEQLKTIIVTPQMEQQILLVEKTEALERLLLKAEKSGFIPNNNLNNNVLQPNHVSNFQPTPIPAPIGGTSSPNPTNWNVPQQAANPQPIQVPNTAPKPLELSSSQTIKDSWIINPSGLFLDQKILGRGGCGVVHQGKWGEIKVAVKQLHGALSEEALKEFQQEAKFAASLHHKHVVQLYGVTQEFPYYMIMEYMDKGSLRDVLNKENLDWITRVKCGLKAARGLAFLHQQAIIHRDMKSLNILVGKNYEIKLSDFGLSKMKQSTRSLSRQNLADGRMGTVPWKAPELFGLGAQHTYESDVYSLGMVLWEISTGALPYAIANGDEDQIRAYVVAGNRDHLNPQAPPFLNGLIGRCWDQNPKNRPALAEVIAILKQGLRQLKDQAFQASLLVANAPVVPSVQGGMNQGHFMSTGRGQNVQPQSAFFANSGDYFSGGSYITGGQSRVMSQSFLSHSMPASPYQSGIVTPHQGRGTFVGGNHLPGQAYPLPNNNNNNNNNQGYYPPAYGKKF